MGMPLRRRRPLMQLAAGGAAAEVAPVDTNLAQQHPDDHVAHDVVAELERLAGCTRRAR